MILFFILLHVTGVFDITSPCKSCKQRSYASQDENNNDYDDYDDESSIETKTIPPKLPNHCERRSEETPNDFKITPLRGIYKHTTNHDDSIMLHDLSILEGSNEGIDISTDYSTGDDYGYGVGITSMSNMPLSTPAMKKKRDKYDPTKLITKNSSLSPSPNIVSVSSDNSTIPTLSKSYSGSGSSSSFDNKENINDYHIA